MLFLNSVNNRQSKTAISTLLLIALIITPLIGLISIQPASAAETVLTSKWTRSSIGTNWEGGLVIGDVTGDGREDVVCAGGSTVFVLNGLNGNTVASYQSSRIYRYCQPQLYDVDGDGVLDILIPLYSAPGLAAVKYSGTATLSLLWSVNAQSGLARGSVMAKPVAGDIDGDGHIDIFLASQDVSPAYNFNNATGTPVPSPDGYTGTISRIDYQGHILAQTFCWRACSGGLSLGDTDNDGTFELYMGDRQIYYGDGNYGKGTRSFWAANLTERWNRLDFLSSSQAPVLADVNGDGVKEVICGMYSEMNVLNSTNGQLINKWSNNQMSCHYGFTVADIDSDGHLELLCSDGDHDDQAFGDVYDLVTGQNKAELSYAGGDWKWSPVVADISPTSPGMEIICAPNGTTLNGWRGVLMIYDSQFQSLQNVTTSMSTQMGYPVVQDIDGDGLLEVVVGASSGSMYAFDTVAPAPGYSGSLPGTQRIRSDVTYFGEDRLGVAQHTVMPGQPNYWTAPLVAPIAPADNALKVSQSTTQLSFRLRDDQSNPLTYTVTTLPDVGSASGSSTGNSINWGTYTLNLNQALQYDTTYRWTVTASDGSQTTQRTYTFRTALAPNAGNTVPTHDSPALTSQDGLPTANSTFVCTPQNTQDVNGDTVTNIYRWSVNGVQTANLILPFDTRNEVTATDYSAFGNNGKVTGATWVPNGRVGGAYSFDGKDDAIIVSDGGVGYYDNKTHNDYNPELGGGGTWTELTVEAWIYLTAPNTGSRIVAKLPSYELGFASGSTNRLTASVWPETFLVNYNDDNHASSDRSQTVNYNANLQLNTWYHIAMTYESGVGLKLFLNGVQVAQRTGISGPLENSSGEPVYIGRLVQPFAGMIDEVRMYPYAQPSWQIFNSYTSSNGGVSSGSMFNPAGLAEPGSTLTCQVIPTDSFGDGTAKSISVTTVNTPPVVSNLLLYPIRDRSARLDGDNLQANYTYVDADGNTELGTQIRWYRDGILQTSFNDALSVPASSTSIGQTWYFTVLPRDNDGAVGELETSATFTIRGNTLPSTGTPTLTSANGGEAYDDEELTGTAAATTDANGDATTNIFHWTKGGVSQTNLQMPFDTEVPMTPGVNSATRDYSGYNNNGVVNGSTWEQDGVVGGALNCDGNDYVTVQENSNSLGGSGSWSAISIEFWIKASGGTTSTQTVLFKPDASYAPGVSSYGLGYRVQYRYAADSYRVYWIVGNNTAQISTNQRVYEAPDQWHHVVCTYQSGVGLKIYTDGIQRGATLAATGNINATIGGLLYLGGVNSGVGDFSGQMDEVRIYATALSAAQVFQRYVDTSDGVSDSETIVPQETASGDSWMCQVIPNDSWGDGTAVNSLSLSVGARNTQPHIDWYSPANSTLSTTMGNTISFAQTSSDPNSDVLTYVWALDGIQQDTTQNWNYTATTSGTHHVRVTVSDGSLSDMQEWTVNVASVTSYDLTILTSSNGNTDPAAGVHPYLEGTPVSIQANPNVNYRLDYWLLDNVNVGDANPIVITMDANHELSAVFVEIPPPTYHQLSVSSTGSGSTNPTGTNEYLEGSDVQVTATAASNWQFDHWQLDSSDAGSVNPFTVTMDANHNLVAVFVEKPQYQLTVTSTGSGTTNPSGTNMYYEGTSVQVTATAGTGSKLDHWTLNGNNVGAANPYTVTMNANNELVAVFAVIPDAIFQDDFESGDFTAWSSTTRTTSETTSVVSNIVHQGSYSAMLTASGNGGYERAYASRSGLNLAELYARAYVYVDQSGIDANGDRFYFIQMMSGGNALAYAGWRQDASGNLHWHIMVRDGTNTVGAYSTAIPATDTWYCVELHWKADATTGLAELYVNGDVVASITARNTANYGSATVARIGLPEIYNCAATTTYVDDVAINNVYIGPTDQAPPEYVSLTVASAVGGVTNPSAGTYQYVKDSTANVEATANSGYELSGWLLDGTPVANTNPYTITMAADHTITPVFTAIPQHQLVVSTSGSGTTNATGTTQYNEGSSVAVLATADSHWQFDHWLLNAANAGATNPYVQTMDADYALTAVFVPIEYTLTVTAVGDGSVDVNPNQATYQYGATVTLTANANGGSVFSAWTGDASGTDTQIIVTITGNTAITATFNPESTNIVLTDNFESGTLGAWSSNSATSGETLGVTTNPVHGGTYAANFATNGGGGYEKAYVAKTLSPSLGLVDVQASFNLVQNGIVENGDRVKLIELRAGSTVIASAGLIERSGTLRWWLETRDGTSYVETYAQSTTDFSSWFTLDFQWQSDGSAGGASLIVNGAAVITVGGDNTSNYGGCTEVRVGLPEVYNCASTRIALDDVTITAP